jgi:hypothetical protein
MPNIEVGRCLGPEGSGDSSRGGDEGGLGPPGMKGDNQSAPYKGDKQPTLTNGDKQPAPNKGDGQLTPNEEGGNMEKEEEERSHCTSLCRIWYRTYLGHDEQHDSVEEGGQVGSTVVMSTMTV